MTTVALSLVSHTNAGKTTLARTLLGRDIGEVRDAPHVTEFADEYLLVESPAGHKLVLWDTPGFGDSVRLARRMRQAGSPLAWLLTQVWDRWRDRAFWASQQALRHVKDHSDVLLYLVNASEPEAGYLASEMQLLAWTAKPVIVLLNQLGPPRTAEEEARELAHWRERLAPWPMVRTVLSLDAFARCWVHEEVLLRAVREALAAEGPDAASADKAQAMDALREAWARQREAQFERAMQELAASLARLAALREEVPEPASLGERLRDWGARLMRPADDDPLAQAGQRLAAAVEREVRAGTHRLLELHGLVGAASTPAEAGGVDPVARILERVAAQVEQRKRIPEGRSAVLGGAITGALAGLKADLATGGLTLGGGLLAGGILGALGAAGLARGINLVRGTDRSWVALGADALPSLTEAALLRYLAVAHYGRGRGEWAESEAPAHWPAAVAAALAPRREAFERAWRTRPDRPDRLDRSAAAEELQPLAQALQPLLGASARAVLAGLYPLAERPPAPASHNRPQ